MCVCVCVRKMLMCCVVVVKKKESLVLELSALTVIFRSVLFPLLSKAEQFQKMKMLERRFLTVVPDPQNKFTVPERLPHVKKKSVSF